MTAVDLPPVGPDELEARARTLLSPTVYDYFAGGSDDELSVGANRAAFDRWRFRYHVLAESGAPDPSVRLLGTRLDLPVVLAPTAVQRLAHPAGEVASAKAAARAGTIFSLSTLASTSIEDVAASGPGDRGFQLYIYHDRGATGELLDRAFAAGYKAILLTVDTPVLGRRERDMRNAFSLPEGVSYANLGGGASSTEEVPEGESGLANYVSRRLDPNLGWKDLAWLVQRSPVPVLVKGVVRGDDAERALAEGAAGIIVSNHGGRQLDSSIATLDALPDVVESVAGRVPVLVDGGIRRGTDVLKAICRGADATMIGRPYLWALACGGEAGVHALLRAMGDEIRVGMSLLGVRRLGDLSRDLLVASD